MDSNATLSCQKGLSEGATVSTEMYIQEGWWAPCDIIRQLRKETYLTSTLVLVFSSFRIILLLEPPGLWHFVTSKYKMSASIMDKPKAPSHNRTPGPPHLFAKRMVIIFSPNYTCQHLLSSPSAGCNCDFVCTVMPRHSYQPLSTASQHPWEAGREGMTVPITRVKTL